jgi:4-amino-4-deoxy-L-arabinose transferase-like glycosyltransferase
VHAASIPAVFVTMFALGLSLSMRVLNKWDESWFLEVIHRVRDGDVLYRDVGYGAGPLPVYLTQLTTYVVGVDVLAEKIVVALTFAATAALVWVIAERLGLELAGRLLAVAAIAYFSPPLQEAPYAPLATLFVVAAFLAALLIRSADTPNARTAASLAGGAACGLGFVSKQNVGVYALVALVLVLAVDRQLKHVLQAAAAFCLSAALVLLPILLEGGFARYLDYGFTGKGEYLNSGLSFTAGLDPILQAIRDIHSVASAETAYWALRFFLPCVAAVGLIALVVATRRRRSVVVLPLVVFAAVAGATLFPRFDPGHVAWAAPMLVLLLAYLLHLWRAAVPRLAWVALATWLGASIVIMAAIPLRLARSPEANLSDLPHLHGAFVNADDAVRWRREAGQLSAAAQGKSDGLLLLVPDAGFRYLTSGLENPTAFDFPFVTTFGDDGQERVIRALASGSIPRVCLGPDWFGFEPAQLVDYVRRTMRPGAELDICTVYENAG